MIKIFAAGSILFLSVFTNIGFSQDAKPDTQIPEAEESQAEGEGDISHAGIFFYKSPVKKGPDDKVWSYKLGGWYSKTTGNADILTWNIASSLAMDTNIIRFSVLFSKYFSSVNNVANTDKGSATVKYDQYVFKRVEAFVFSKSDYNKINLLDHRNNSGTGAKYVFFLSDYLKLDISLAVINQYEKFAGGDSDIDYRWSLRNRIELYPAEGLTISCVYFYVPRLDNRFHYRTELLSFISYKLAPKIDVKIGYNSEYNKNTPPGTKKQDDNVYAQLSLNL